MELDQTHYDRPNLPYRGRFSVNPLIDRPSALPGALSAGISLAAEGLKSPSLDRDGSLVPTGPFNGVAIDTEHPSLSIYDHRPEMQESTANDALARMRLEQLRADVLVGRGHGNSPRLAPGYAFALEGALSGLEGGYVVTSISHKGEVAHRELHSDQGAAPDISLTYSNDFEASPSYVTARPERPVTRVQQVIETATVVGPGQSEGAVYTDSMGRIKVHFPWDWGHVKNEHASCWIRSAQVWGGRSWGFQFLPRVGMEVLVGFLGGDVDRPILLGAAYNATHPLPF